MTFSDTEDFAKLCAVVLGINEENIDTACKTLSFGKIWKRLFDEKTLNKKNIEAAKNEIIAEFKKQNSEEFKNSINAALAKLCEEKIISAQTAQNYKELLVVAAKNNTVKLPRAQITKAHDIFTDKTFHEKLEILFKLLSETFELIESSAQRLKLEKAKKTLLERSFSIGVTGVMNAGKSTLLNAILRADILGTAVVPETANLTVLKYSPTPKAKVNFWNAYEWQSMEKSGEFLPRIGNFIENTKNKFGDTLNDFITNEGKSEEISVHELGFYTSAAKSDMKCNLVKSVELYTDLAFLKDGVMIVDTPGLDDPVIKREEITKEYLSSCDLMIHLMNAAQSATAKDIDFIIDALTYQGISRRLVFITRSDAISKEELGELIEYAKTSIKVQLERQKKGELFGTIIDKIEFIPVAAKLALMHRTGRGKEADEAGYSEEASGIFAVENYLNNVLFGNSSEKANLLITSNAKTIYIAASESLNAYEKESENLNKSSAQLRVDLKNLQSQNSAKEAKIEHFLFSVKTAIKELEEFAKTLLFELDARANSLQAKIFSRVFDDVKYELEKNKKKPSNERITYIIQNGLKDGIVDLVRDYRFSFSKQSALTQERLLLQFEDLKLDTAGGTFDVKAFFASNTFGIKQDFEELKTRVLTSLKQCAKSTLDEFAQNLNTALKDEFVNIKTQLNALLSNLNDTLLDEFQAKNEEPLNLLQSTMREEIANLNNQIELVEQHEVKAKERSVLVREKCVKLKDIMEKLAGLHGSI
ncbi:MAG: dynamin family protein [Campylobacteraceae bacterium]|jgi:predicted GTPase|nr:dynamin family protein [Campylobacteraceae bacterium]